jgi:cystathionine beta-lyase/cystathionine gamma-synthase
MERQCENARRLAGYLEGNSHLARVHFPGLGALVSIELRDNTRAAAFRFMDALQLCVRSTSLGDVFTSVLHPATASHRDLIPARREALGIIEGLVRISVGIESIDDIIADIDQALATDQ